MNTNQPNEIIQKWKRLQDVEQERDRFDDYVTARNRYLSALEQHARGEMSNLEFQKALGAEISTFDAYVAARTQSSYRK